MYTSKLRSFARVVSLSILFFVFCFSIFAQSTSQNDADQLIGTWLKDGVSSGIYKLVFAPDGKALEFRMGYDAPENEARYSIEKRWIDEDGNTWHKCLYLQSYFPYGKTRITKWFGVLKISPSGDALESSWS
jgi:hypothetical protein